MYLGLDLGTTNIKAVVVNTDGEIVVRHSRPVRIEHLGHGRVEQDIKDIWSGVRDVLGKAGRANKDICIKAIGVSSQGGAMQVRDRGGKCVGKVISWMDQRGRAYDEQLTREMGREWFCEHAGHGRSALTIGQILRMKDEGVLPEEYRLSFVGDYIVERLCGHAAHDATSLSLGMLYNPATGIADAELLFRLGLSKERMAELVEIGTPAGHLLDDVADGCCLPRGVPVSGAVHDQYAAAIGCGAVHCGDVMLATGTAWVLLAVSDVLWSPVDERGFVCRHPAGQGLYGQILSLGDGGSAIEWGLKQLNVERDSHGIDDILSGVAADCDGLRCDAKFIGGDRGAKLEGLKLHHTGAHVLRAIVEGLAREVADRVALLREGGLEVRKLLLCGPASEGRVIPEILGACTGVEVKRCPAADMSAYGAAMVARGLIHAEV